MARINLGEFLQVYPFFLFDVAPIDAISLPILTPLFGFSSITAPEIQVNTHEITEGNYFFTRKTIKGASVSNITLTRGSAFYDSDFWRWTRAALEGNTQLGNGATGALTGGLIRAQLGGPTPRRTLVLMHFFSKSVVGTALGSGGVGKALGVGAVAVAAGIIGGQLGGYTGGLIAAGQVAAGAGIAAALDVGPFEFAARLPAKAWVLSNCLPARWKAGSDFDASDAKISIQELEISCEAVEEISLFA